MRGSRMGRGRQKAKHTKVARDLKYYSPDTNYNALEKELGGGSSADPRLQDDLAAWPEYAGATYGEDDTDEDDESESEGVAQNKSA
jgi:hypothetical protein